MANYTVNVAKHASLTGSVVDVITLTGSASYVMVTNRSLSGTPIYFTIGDTNTPPVDPAAAGNDTYNVSIGSTLQIPFAGTPTVVKLISADAQSYSVMVT